MISEKLILANGKRYALAVSGGIDSMVMLTLLASAAPAANVFAVTVNHGIRPEAASDCRLVADYCAKLGVECRTFCVDVPTFATQNKLSTETAARILRYRVFDGLDCDFVCLAHNADDNAETVLMHIVRGSGARGATGMKYQNGKYLRPMLQWTRADIERYAVEHNVPFVHDSTNDDTQYSRNFVRHKVMPLLAQLNPAVKQSLLRFAQNIARDDTLLDAQAEEKLKSVLFDDEGAHIPTALVAEDYRLLDKVFNRLGVHCDIEQKHYLALFELARNVGGKRLEFPFDLVAYNDYDLLTICPNRDAAVYRFEIPFALGSIATPLGTVQVAAEGEGLRIDASKVGNAVFRTRREGDIFTKFGGGTKPLNRYLIDKKIPERKRDSLLLLTSGSEVLAIVGVEISDKLRVEPGVRPTYIGIK